MTATDVYNLYKEYTYLVSNSPETAKYASMMVGP